MPALIASVWQMFASLYGHKFVSSYGAEPDPDRVWTAALAGISEAQVKHGMRCLVQRGDVWPPGAPEFRALCVGNFEEEAAHREAPRLALPDLAALERGRAAGAEALARMKALFRNGNGEGGRQ